LIFFTDRVIEALHKSGVWANFAKDPGAFNWITRQAEWRVRQKWEDFMDVDDETFYNIVCYAAELCDEIYNV
jgi:hypothetical protein